MSDRGTMTRKDYVMLAAALASSKPVPDSTGTNVAQHARDCKAIANALAENPRFDRDRFLKACGVE